MDLLTFEMNDDESRLDFRKRLYFLNASLKTSNRPLDQFGICSKVFDENLFK